MKILTKYLKILLLVVDLSFGLVQGLYVEDDDLDMHPTIIEISSRMSEYPRVEEGPAYWNNMAREKVEEILNRKQNTNKAKNVILFLGDGMSITTVTAARIYQGQLNDKDGENSQLSFEKFPSTGFSKTYCVNMQVPDSACTSTAYLSGVKGNYATIGVSAKVTYDNCRAMRNASNHVHSLAKNFIDHGRSAGIVTTARVTHASPAGAYAHTANRKWETDSDVKKSGHDPTFCRDIAYQLVHGDPGRDLKVILGGGRRSFRPIHTKDEEEGHGKRSDGRDLIEDWKNMRSKLRDKYKYVWNRGQLLNLEDSTTYVLGLFESSHCKFHLESDASLEPTLEEMVETAINILSKDDKGFFLFVEGGRIDHAHHSVRAKLALDETVEFSKAIAKAVNMTSSKDTLIVVTSDHAHSMTMSGYSSRGNPITGISDVKTAADGLGYLTLGYANGKGYRKEVNGKRVDISKEDIGSPRFRYPSMVPLESETHGGEDVGVFARGPWNHIFTGVYEQNTIPHLIRFAACLDKKHPC